jgi:hypothetical protein
MKRFTFAWLIEKYLLLFTGTVVFLYLILFLFLVPNKGFMWYPDSKEIFWVDPNFSSVENGVKVGDRVVFIGAMTIENYSKLFGPPLWTLVTPQYTLPLQVDRAGQHLNIDWPVQHPGAGKFGSQLLNFLPAIFCLIAAGVVQVFMRPKNLLRRLLMVVLCLTTLWVFCGARNDLNLPLADVLYSLTLWLWMPALLYLMWIYPYSLGVLPDRLILGAFLAAILLSLLHLSSLTPRYSYLLFFAATILVSLILFALHFLLRKKAG